MLLKKKLKSLLRGRILRRMFVACPQSGMSWQHYCTVLGGSSLSRTVGKVSNKPPNAARVMECRYIKHHKLMSHWIVKLEWDPDCYVTSLMLIESMDCCGQRSIPFLTYFEQHCWSRSTVHCFQSNTFACRRTPYVSAHGSQHTIAALWSISNLFE